jgi:hypothetical protein
MRLEIGAGKKCGWVTIDAVKQADFVCEVPPLPDDVMQMKFDRVESCHFWEHLYHWQAVELAEQIYTVLNPGGVLSMELPDLNKACEYFLGLKNIPVLGGAPCQPDPRFTLWRIYGPQTDPNVSGNKFMAHKWGYTPDSIKEQLYNVGFKTVTVSVAKKTKPLLDMLVEAIK